MSNGRKRFRLVKVIVQPVFVADDGETLEEMPQQPIEVKAADWPAFAERLEQSRLDAERELNEPSDLADGGTMGAAG